MGVSNISPQMINMQIQNIITKLENFKLQIFNLVNSPIQLQMNGFEVINIGTQILELCIFYSKIEMGMQRNFNLEIQNIVLICKILELIYKIF